MKEIVLNTFILELMKDASSKNAPSEKTQKAYDKWSEDILKKRKQYNAVNSEYVKVHLEPRENREVAVKEFIEKAKVLKDTFYKADDKNKKSSLRTWMKHIGSISNTFTDPPSTLFTIYPNNEKAFYV